MYAYFKGELEGITDDGIIVEVNGIGYNIRLPKENIPKLPPLHYKVQIFTYTSVREDAFQLYGFLSSGNGKQGDSAPDGFNGRASQANAG